MPIRADWDDEHAARSILEHYLGGAAASTDPGGGPEQMHDAIVVLPNGDTIAVEITRETNDAREATISALDARDWHFDGLTLDWHLAAVPSFSVSNLHRKIRSLLLDLEALGVGNARVGEGELPADIDAEFANL